MPLLGIQLPPNYGPRYIETFSRVYGAVVAQGRTVLASFSLEGVGEAQGVMRVDDIYLALAVQPRLLKNAWPTLKPPLWDLPGKPFSAEVVHPPRTPRAASRLDLLRLSTG